MSPSPVPVAIIGVSGFSGAELARLVADHPSFSLVAAAADRWRGRLLGECVRLREYAKSLEVAPMSAALEVARKAEVALLATPAEVSARLAPELLAQGTRVVDLSGAFRLQDPEAYPRWYGFPHPAPELLAEAHYGLPELPGASARPEAAAQARLVANPGCYATAAILALAPLLAAGAIEPSSIYIDGKSGVSGAGRKNEEKYLFMEVAENLSPYRIGDHQHTPEIEQALARVAARPVSVTFVPHLLPVKRGLLVTAFARLSGEVAAAEIPALYARAFAGAALVETCPPEEVSLARVVHTPLARIGARADAERGTVVVTSALDNLLKGAASQALQNLCTLVGATPFP